MALTAAIHDLDEPDRRLAHEIAAGVLRARTELDATLAPTVTRGWRSVAPDLQDVLRIGAYQILRLNRVPPHAAVDTAVTLARETGDARSAGFVNAVLRSVARARDEAPAAPPPPDGAGLAARYSHPQWLVDRWVARFGPARTEALLIHNNARPPIVLQPARWTREALCAALGRAGIAYRERPGLPGVLVEGAVRQLPGYEEGGFIVQDSAHALAVDHAAIPPGARVWDGCAAPGGKTVALARGRRVVASDRTRARLALLADTARRAAPAVWLVAADLEHAPFPPAAFDAVVLDAPCSGTGTMRRHPEARWRLHRDALPRLVALQDRLLRAASGTVRPGGRLAYLTCSLEAEENDQQVERFLAARPEYERDGDDLVIFPPDADTDGAYAARLVRAG